MIALVIGSTGSTGTELVQQLLKDTAFIEVRSFAQRDLEFSNPKLKQHKVDFEHPNDWKNLVQGDVAFSCLGSTLKDAGSKKVQWKIDYDYQYNFAKIASENGIRHFVLVSAFNANSKSFFFYSKMKGQLEEAIKQLPFKALTYFKPGLLERKNTNRMGEIIGLKIIKSFNSLGLLKKQKPLTTENLAKAMIAMAKREPLGFTEVLLEKIEPTSKETR